MKKMSELDEKLKYETFITPDFVYIPIHASKVAFAPKSYVYDSTLLLIDDNKGQVYSSCSGTLIGTSHVMTTNGRMNAMVIENDFLEKKKNSKGTKKQIFKMKSEEMTTVLKSFNLDYGFNGKETLLIALSYNKNTMLNDRTLLKENVIELLEIVDAISSAYDIEKVLFSVQEEDEISYDILKEYTGTYHNFSYTCTKFNATDKEKIAKKLLGKEKDKYVCVTLNDVDSIGRALKSKRLLKNRFVTISGGSLKKPIVVYAKIGTCIIEILSALKIKPEKKNIKLIGKCTVEASANEAVVTRDLESIVLMK